MEGLAHGSPTPPPKEALQMKKKPVNLVAGILMALSLGSGLAQFSDVPAGHWAKEAVEVLAAKGILTGFPDGSFRGNEPLTRYQAALILYRFLQEMGSASGSLSPKDLEVVKNALQELASDLVALGVRLSSLKEAAATKEDIKRIEALLKGLGTLEPGIDPAAIQDLVDRAMAASVAASTALNQVQALAEQQELLAQGLEDTKGDLAALSDRVEANAQAIEALMELVVLLGQDVLSFGKKLEGLEKALAEQKDPPPIDLDRFATKEDMAGLREFVTAQTSSLAERTSRLEGQVAELSKTQYSVRGSVTVAYGATASEGEGLDVDRLFPGNAFSTGATGNASSPVQREDIAGGRNLSGGTATLTFTVKNSVPAGQGVAVSEAGFTLGLEAFADGFRSVPAVRFDGASLKGAVDGQPFSVVYSWRNSAFRFNDYLFANDNDPEEANPRQGLVATFSGTKFPLSPEVTLVAGAAGAGADASPALRGNYFGLRVGLEPFSGFKVALSYANNLGLRSAAGVDGKLELGPLGLSGLWVSSQDREGSFAGFLDSARSHWSYYVRGEAKLGAFSLAANYHAVDPAYADGQAGMSANEDTTHYGGLKGSAPYGPDTRGLGFSASASLGALTLKGYAESETAYSGGDSTHESALGASLTLGPLAGFSLTGFYNAFYAGGAGYFDLRAPGEAGGSYNNGYDYREGDGKYSSSFGLRLTHSGLDPNALVPALNLTAQYTRFYVAGYEDLQVYGGLVKPLELGFLNLSPGFRYHSFTGPNAPTGDYTTLKVGVQASTDPVFSAVTLEGTASYRQTRYAGNSTSDDPEAVKTPRTAEELYYRVGLKIEDFLAPKASFSVAYALYGGRGLAGSGLAAVGAGDHAFDFGQDGIYDSPNRKPWEARPGTRFGLVEGLYLQVDYHNFSLAYGAFLLSGLARASWNAPYGEAFRVRYTVNF
jgi:hypothetical protein